MARTKSRAPVIRSARAIRCSAMPRLRKELAGRISVSGPLYGRLFGRHGLAINAELARGHHRLAAIDAGAGFRDDHRHSLFQPFFPIGGIEDGAALAGVSLELLGADDRFLPNP